MYLFLVDLRTLEESQYKYFERLLPEIKAHRLLGEVKNVESNAAAVQIMLDNARRDRFKTVVAVGDDRFMACVAGAALGTNTALGYIPFGKMIAFGTAMGLNSRVGEVGPVLAGRHLTHRPLMVLGRYYAVHSVELMPRTTWEMLHRQRSTWAHRLGSRLSFWTSFKSLTSLAAQVEWKDACLNQPVAALTVGLVSSPRVKALKPKEEKQDNDTMLLRLFSSQLALRELSPYWDHLAPAGLEAGNRFSQLKASYVRITIAGDHGVWVDGHPSAADPPLDIRLVTSAFRLITPVERL